MRLYLVRHAIAVERGSLGVANDAMRELTPDGIKKMRAHVEALARLGVTLDEIWTSPLLRARQTAELLATGLGVTLPPRVVDALSPGGDPDAINEEIRRRRELDGIALVGHEPSMGEYATYLLAGSPMGSIRFRKGGAACFEIDDFHTPLRGELAWLLTPKQLRMIA